ncbi:MAG: GNAT family protein [Pseudomonadota bacterium]
MKLGEPVEGFRAPPHPKGVTLSGARVRLAPLCADAHARQLFEANSHDADGANWVYLPYGPFDDAGAYADWLRAQEDGDDPAFFTIIRRVDDRAVGIASYLRITPGDGVIEVGHIHFSPLLQNTAAGTEAMALMMRWAFEAGYRRYEWKCNALNVKSRRAAQRLGLSYEGVFRQLAISKGRNRDTAWFAAIDKEWPALAACFEAYLDPANFDAEGAPIRGLSERTRPLLHKIDDMALA